MIRKFKYSDIKQVLNIWLECNIQAHSFIPAKLWEQHLDFMYKVLPKSEVFVYIQENKIIAFIGLETNYIAGLFVKRDHQSQGIGRKLINYIKNTHNMLTLSVYQSNKTAVNFYIKEGVKITKSTIDKNTNEKEFFMLWKKDN